MASMEFKNNARSTVADNPFSIGATTLNVATGEGANFPSSFPFKLTIFDDSSYPDAGLEIVKCTGRTVDALTIVRAQEGTADVEHAFGERVAMLITAGHFNDAVTGIVTKLDTIEPSAKDDQSGTEIKVLYEAELDTNAYTDNEKSKLSGIETAADVTDATNVAAAGAVMDSDIAITLDTIDEQTLAAGVTIETVLVKDGNVDGRDVSVDGTKLDTIETSAKDDQTASEVPIVDAGAKITATEVEGALQENRTAIDLNTAKDTNVSTNLSEGTSTETTVDVNSSDGTNATLLSASTTRAGVLTKAKFDEIVANTLKVTNETHTGEVTGSVALTIAPDAVTYDKMQDTTATDKILGRSTAGAGTIEEIACTAAGRALLDDIDVAAQIATLGLGNAKTVNQMLWAESAYLPETDFALTGTVTMTNASTAVTGSTTAFDTELQVGDYIKLDADTSTSWAKVASIESATGLTLSAVYAGTGGASAGSGSGNPASLSEELGSGRYMGHSIMKFDDTLLNPDSGERCGWRIPMPDYDGGNISILGILKPATTPVGAVTCVFDIWTVGIATSESFDKALPIDTGVNLSFSLNTTESDEDGVFANATIDPANVASDDLMVIELSRDVATDTLVGDGELVGISIEYQRT